MTVAARTSRRRRRLVSAAVVLAVVLAVLAAAALVGACATSGPDTDLARVRGSGHAVSQPRDVPPFAQVELAGSARVTVRVGRAQSLVVTADDNVLRHVITRVHGSTLVIGTRGSFSTRVPLQVAVAVPRLEGATLSGSGILLADGVRGERLRATMSGSGRLAAVGTATRVEALLSGSGELALGGLVARDAAARLTGVGQITVFATRRLVADLSGTGAIRYRGDPATVTKQISGTGAVVPGG